MYFDKYLLYRNMFKIKVVHVNETYISFVWWDIFKKSNENPFHVRSTITGCL